MKITLAFGLTLAVFHVELCERALADNQGRIIEDTSKEAFFGTPRSERAQLFLSKILGH